MAADAGGGRHVHHVERGAGHALGQPQHAAEAQVLRQRVVHLGHVLEADAALADQLGVHVHDDVVVLGVDDAEPALLGQHLEGLPDVAEIDHAARAVRPDVGGEDLDGRIAGLDRLRQLGELRVRRLARQHQVVGPVAAALRREVRIARLDGRLHALVGAHVGEIDQRGGAAVERRHADPVGSLRVEDRAVGHHEGMLHVHVRVDAAGHDDLAHRVDHSVRHRRRPACPGAATAAMVSPLMARSQLRHALRRHHVAAANDQIQHACPRQPSSGNGRPLVCTKPHAATNVRMPVSALAGVTGPGWPSGAARSLRNRWLMPSHPFRSGRRGGAQ